MKKNSSNTPQRTGITQAEMARRLMRLNDVPEKHESAIKVAISRAIKDHRNEGGTLFPETGGKRYRLSPEQRDFIENSPSVLETLRRLSNDKRKWSLRDEIEQNANDDVLRMVQNLKERDLRLWYLTRVRDALDGHPAIEECQKLIENFGLSSREATDKIEEKYEDDFRELDNQLLAMLTPEQREYLDHLDSNDPDTHSEYLDVLSHAKEHVWNIDLYKRPDAPLHPDIDTKLEIIDAELSILIEQVTGAKFDARQYLIDYLDLTCLTYLDYESADVLTVQSEEELSMIKRLEETLKHPELYLDGAQGANAQNEELNRIKSEVATMKETLGDLCDAFKALQGAVDSIAISLKGVEVALGRPSRTE